MRTEHGLDAVGDQLARRQGKFHARVAHRNAVIDADGVENKRNTTRLAHETFYQRADLVEVSVTGNAVDVAVADRDERLVKVRLGFNHARGAEETAMRSTFKALLNDVGAHDGKNGNGRT